MTPSSAKQKGRSLQQWVCSRVYALFPSLTQGDVESRSMGANGTDVMLSPAAKSLFPFAVECKNIARFVGYTFMEQAKANAKGKDIALVIVKQNKSNPLVILQWDDFETVIKGGK